MKVPHSFQLALLSVAAIAASAVIDISNAPQLSVESNVFDGELQTIETSPGLTKRDTWNILNESKDAAIAIAIVSAWSKAITKTCNSGNKGACYASITGLAMSSAAGMALAGYTAGTSTGSLSKRASENDPVNTTEGVE